MQLLAGLVGATARDGTPLELPEIPLTPRCFQTRRLVRYRGSWYVFPNEEPRPSGDGEGGIVKSMGLDGFSDPRLLWQSSVPDLYRQRAQAGGDGPHEGERRQG